MINLFSFPSNDQSLYYLSQIFGSMNGIIPTPTGSGGSISLLGTMFQTFNTVVLAVGALVVVYTTVVGVIMTAHEGEFMGKKWNNPWIPIRMVLGIACLVPSGSGYSGIQIIMMWIIIQGIGAADTLWNTVLVYLNIAGSPYAQVTLPSLQVNQSLTTIFQGLVCDASAKMTAPNPLNPKMDQGGYFCAQNPTNPFCTGIETIFPSSSYTSQMGPQGNCGSFSYCNQALVCSASGANSIPCLACNAQITALTSIIPLLQGIAQKFVQDDYDYQHAYNYNPASKTPPPPMPPWVQNYCAANNLNPCTKDNLPDPGIGSANAPNEVVNTLYWPFALKPSLGQGSFISTVTSYYLNTVTGAVNAYISQQASNPNISDPVLQQAQTTGWIFAGAFYYYISKMAGNNLTAANPAFSATPNDPSGNPQNPLRSYRNNFDAAQTLVSASSATTSSGASSQTSIGAASPQFSGVGNIFQQAFVSVFEAFTNTLTPKGQSPLTALVNGGQVLLGIAEGLFVVFIGATVALTGAGYFDVFVLGTGVDNPLGPMTTTMYMIIVPLLLALLGVLIAIGGSLAIYLPLMPYMIFLFGVVSWFLSTIESMVAGPLVALGILSPSGQHELLGKAEPAIMLLFFVFLRPSLMIFGLMAAMLLAVVVVTMVNVTFNSIVAQITSGDPIELILFFVAYVFLIITALNKCYEAIYIIPQRVMDWIGGHAAAREGGEGGALGEMKGGVSAGAGAAGGAGQWVGGQAKAGAEARRKAGKEQQMAQQGLTLSGEERKTPKKKEEPKT